MDGWTGKYLRINLNDGDYVVDDLDEDLARQYLGGRGLATKMYYDEVDPGVDPISPENLLIFATGPLTGVGAVTGCRFAVVTKGYLTDAIASSNSGGNFGPELKYAGYDMIIFEGQADEPVYVLIENDEIEIVSAQEVWGKTIGETVKQVRHELKQNYGKTDWEAREFRIACIGPSGENLVRLATIMTDDGRLAARSGVGAVMGSKNLKAIVVKGTNSLSVRDPEGLMGALLGMWDKIKAARSTGTVYPTYGTPGGVNLVNECGSFPTRNFQSGVFEGASKISGEFMKESIVTRDFGCFSCPIRCGKLTRIKVEGKEVHGKGPEYETLALMGSNCGVDDLTAITEANYILDEYGADTISAGGTIACAMELFEKGYLTEQQVGFPISFGDGKALVKLSEMMAKKEGFGEELAEGSYRLAEKYGHPELFMGVKKQEFPGYEPRATKGMALAYATSNRGACHLRGSTYWAEIVGVPQKVDALTQEGKAQLAKDFQDFAAVIDSSGMCIFAFRGLWKDDMLALLNAVTELGLDLEGMLTIGERIWNLERLFNNAAGYSREGDSLPRRILEEPAPGGPAKGQVVELESMLNEYYELRGWDENGVPTQGKLEELGLD